MPSRVPKNNLLLPNDVIEKLNELDTDLSEDCITLKGYCTRKWKLLQPHVELSISEQVGALKEKLQISNSEHDYYKEMKKLLEFNVKLKLESTKDEEKSSSNGNKDSKVNSAEISHDVKLETKNDGKSNGRNTRSNKTQQTISNMFSASNSKINGKQCKTDEIIKVVDKPDDKMEIQEDKTIDTISQKDLKIEITNQGKDNGNVAVENKCCSLDDDDIETEPTGKKPKLYVANFAKINNNSEPENASKSLAAVVPKKCTICHQLINDDDDSIIYPGHPTGAVEEYVALTDPRLMLFNGNENDIDELDERPQNKITSFIVYDKEGHLCPFDTGLVERNVFLYFSGYVKAVYEESSDIEGGIPAYDIGPINEWWISGFDGGEKALIGFSTAYGEYYLMQPSKVYEPFMEAVTEKIYMGKLVIEFLLDEVNPTYEDLLNKLQTTVPPKGVSALTEDSLLRHAQFICDQVQSFDAASDPSDEQLITTPCMRNLVKLCGITFRKRKAMRQTEKRGIKQKKKDSNQWSKATTTPLVSEVFETFFTEQLDKAEIDIKGPGSRRQRCGVCEACQQPDCGTCSACLDKVKFGGAGSVKQACIGRRCPNMAIQEADDSDIEEDSDGNSKMIEENNSHSWTSHSRGISIRSVKVDISWIGEPVKEEPRRSYYSKANVGSEEVTIGSYVLVEPSDPGIPMYVAYVVYMWEEKLTKAKFFHGQWMCRGSDTVLGETSDENELFVLYECENLPMSAVKSSATVVYRPPPDNWALEGGQIVENLISSEKEDNGKTFFYQKRHDPQHCRFEDIEEDLSCTNKDNEYRFCTSCERVSLLKKRETPTLDEKLVSEGKNNEVQYGVVRWIGEEFRVGSFVYLKPDTFKFKRQSIDNSFAANKKEKETIDEDLYPEHYRKTSDRVKGSNETTPPPFCIGYIQSIMTKSIGSDIYLNVNKLYRPENTHKGPNLSYQADLNKLYWSEEQKLINFNNVAGKCYVIYSENIDSSIEQWTAAGPNRFYFSEAYDSSKKEFDDPPNKATYIGCVGKGKGKGKGKSKSSVNKNNDTPKSWPNISRPLHSLDVFAGCGGLSQGLHQSGVAESWWAIEKEEAAAHAYKLNNPNATVFTEDCNLLLKMAINGERKNEKGQCIPQKGEVELLCGGPPCQGFSGMNRFNSRQYSLFKNSLVVSYLSYCDYYRPRFFLLENVRNFVSFKRSMVLKLALRCLIRMGYQCTFGILQAGNYGVPQTRRRAFIIAAAPGEILPLFPEPTHTFNLTTTQLSVAVCEKKFISNCRWTDSAPRRTITVRDALSDLPEISNGARCDEMSYNGEPLSHFQRLIRGNQYQPILTDHICKDMAPIVEARMAHIPTKSGSDWRDLPNMVVRLSDGSYTKKLEYTHHDKKNGKSSTGALRGVCSCASGKLCDPMDRQFNTLIPWCLPHTGNRHNHWAGLYGRLMWEGFFSTTVTNPEPMGKQGRVLHPEQTRVVSVRECARSQGFPDTYRFYGSILDKHRQIGNAVPPPLGEAIGYELRECVSKFEANESDKNKLEEMEI